MPSQAEAAAGVASGQIGKSPLGVLHTWVAGASEVTEDANKDGGVPVVHNLRQLPKGVGWRASLIDIFS